MHEKHRAHQKLQENEKRELPPINQHGGYEILKT